MDENRNRFERICRKFGSRIDAEIPGRWSREDCEIIRDGVYLAHAENKAAASQIVNAVNADLAALEDDNAMLRVKLKAVLEYLRENAETQCDCKFSDGERSYHCEYCRAYEAACRIADGE